MTSGFGMKPATMAAISPAFLISTSFPTEAELDERVVRTTHGERSDAVASRQGGLSYAAIRFANLGMEKTRRRGPTAGPRLHRGKRISIH